MGHWMIGSCSASSSGHKEQHKTHKEVCVEPHTWCQTSAVPYWVSLAPEAGVGRVQSLAQDLITHSRWTAVSSGSDRTTTLCSDYQN